MESSNLQLLLTEKPEIVEATFIQLNKDLLLAGVNFHIESTTATQGFANLSQLLKELIEGNSAHLFNLFYRIDVSQKALKEVLFSGDYKALAALILQREYQKVMLRERFKQ